jgi:hypothetical protein
MTHSCQNSFCQTGAIPEFHESGEPVGTIRLLLRETVYVDLIRNTRTTTEKCDSLPISFIRNSDCSAHSHLPSVPKMPARHNCESNFFIPPEKAQPIKKVPNPNGHGASNQSRAGTAVESLARMLQTGILTSVSACAIASVASALANSALDGFKSYKDFPEDTDNRIAMDLVFEYLTHHELTRTLKTVETETQGRFPPRGPRLPKRSSNSRSVQGPALQSPKIGSATRTNAAGKRRCGRRRRPQCNRGRESSRPSQAHAQGKGKGTRSRRSLAAGKAQALEGAWRT